MFTRGSGSTKCRERWGGITNVMCVCLLEGLGPPSGGEMGWYTNVMCVCLLEGLGPPSVGRDGVVLLMLCVCVY